MPIYTENFETLPAGVPASLLLVKSTAGGSGTIIDRGVPNGKVLFHNVGSSQNWIQTSWLTPGDVTDFEYQVLIKPVVIGAANNVCNIPFRIQSGASSGLSGCFFLNWRVDGTLNLYVRSAAGVESSIQTFSGLGLAAPAVGVERMFVVRMEGWRVRVRTWLPASQSDPGTWAVDHTIGATHQLYTVGHVGCGSRESFATDADFVSLQIDTLTTSPHDLACAGTLAVGGAAALTSEGNYFELDSASTTTVVGVALLSSEGAFTDFEASGSLEIEGGAFLSYVTATFYREFGTDSVGEVPAGFDAVTVSEQEQPVGQWKVLSMPGAIANRVLEGYHYDGSGMFRSALTNGNLCLRWNLPGSLVLAGSETCLRLRHHGQGSFGGMRWAGGLIINWNGLDWASGAMAILVTVGTSSLYVFAVDAGGVSKTIATVTLPEFLDNDKFYVLRVEQTPVTLETLAPNYYYFFDTENYGSPGTPTGPFVVTDPYLSTHIVATLLTMDGSVIASAAGTHEPSFLHHLAAPRTIASGHTGLQYAEEPGSIQFSYIAVREFEAPDLSGNRRTSSFRWKSPIFGQAGSLIPVSWYAPYDSEGAVPTYEIEIGKDGVWDTLLAPTPVVADSNGVCLLPAGPLNTALLQQSRRWKLRGRSSLDDGVWQESERFFVDRTGETQCTGWNEYSVGVALSDWAIPAGWRNWNLASGWSPKLEGYSSDGVVLRSNTHAGIFGMYQAKAIGWSTAGQRVNHAVGTRVRVNAIQTMAGLLLRGYYGCYFGNSYPDAHGGRIAVRGAVFSTYRLEVDGPVLGSHYNQLAEVRTLADGSVRVRYSWWRDEAEEEPGAWLLEQTFPSNTNETFIAAGLVGLSGIQYPIAQLSNAREYDNFFVTGLDDLPNDLVEPQGFLLAAANSCVRIIDFSWELSGNRVEDLTNVRLQYEVSGSDSWTQIVGNLEVAEYTWNTLVVSPGQYRARLVADLDGAPITLAVSDPFFIVANSAPLIPTINSIEAGENGILVGIEFDDPDLETGDYHAQTRWSMLDRVSGQLLHDTGWQSDSLTEYLFPIQEPQGGYVVVVEVRDRCSASALGQRIQGGSFWNCAIAACPPPAEPIQSSTLWTCGPVVVPLPPEEPPVPPEEPPPIEEPEPEPEEPVPVPPPPEPEPVVYSVQVLPSLAELEVGDTLQLTAQPLTFTGEPVYGRVVIWTTGNTTVVTVGGSGLVTVVGAGSTSVYATCEGVSGTCVVTVTVPPPPPPPPDPPNQPPVADFDYEEV